MMQDMQPKRVPWHIIKTEKIKVKVGTPTFEWPPKTVFFALQEQKKGSAYAEEQCSSLQYLLFHLQQKEQIFDEFFINIDEKIKYCRYIYERASVCDK